MNPGYITLQTTGDGSSTLLLRDLDETYHSRHGALTESRHVFIEAGLAAFAKTASGRPLNVFEMGFGTGLNALLAHMWAEENRVKVYFDTVELMPLPVSLWSGLVFPGIPEERIRAIHEIPWNVASGVSDAFTIRKVTGSLIDITLERDFYDVVFFDAFAPSRQPELWTVAVMEKLAGALRPGGLLVTYCAQGQFKRNLRQAGFFVEALPGPPGKREMVRARKPPVSG